MDRRKLGVPRLHPHARARREPPGAARPGRRAGADPLSALDVLRRDPVLAGLIDAIGPLNARARKRGRPADAYGTLVRSITGQQLSTKAAATIYKRLTGLYGGRTPTPEQIIATDPEQLRAVGLSGAKAAYLRDLAEHIADGELPVDDLAELPDEQVYEALIAVKGLGRWTVDMFLIFHLGRPDVLPVGDLGIRRAMQIRYGLQELPKPSEMEQIAEAWRPHRTLACLYLWESLDNRPGAGNP
jgi:DNA-3-methyladenine glycosylase II